MLVGSASKEMSSTDIKQGTSIHENIFWNSNQLQCGLHVKELSAVPLYPKASSQQMDLFDFVPETLPDLTLPGACLLLEFNQGL